MNLNIKYFKCHLSLFHYVFYPYSRKTFSTHISLLHVICCVYIFFSQIHLYIFILLGVKFVYRTKMSLLLCLGFYWRIFDAVIIWCWNELLLVCLCKLDNLCTDLGLALHLTFVYLFVSIQFEHFFFDFSMNEYCLTIIFHVVVVFAVASNWMFL